MTKVYDELTLLSHAQTDPNLSVTIVDHPLVRSALSVMRDKNTSIIGFRRSVHDLAYFVIYNASCDLRESKCRITTPLADHISYKIKDQVVLIPVLRSGIGMHEAGEKIFPKAPTIFAGMARDEATAIPHWYYDLKQLEFLKQGSDVVFMILDPMIGTGGSAIETIKRVKFIYPKGTIKMVSMIGSPEGIKTLNQAYPDVSITVASVDDHLDSRKYIVPGLGDAGDRQFGTL